MDCTEYKKCCPQCGTIQRYKSKYILNKSIKKNIKCLYCSNVIRGKTSNRLGCHHTDATKKLMSSLKIGVKRTENSKKKQSQSRKNLYKDPLKKELLSKRIKEAMNRPDVRKKHIKSLSESKHLGKSVDKGQLEMINCWNKFGFNFILNYQVYTDDFLCYLDGYDKEKNVVLEYDSKYHNKFGQKEKDLIRQQKIINILKPKKFWRYNSITKQCKNVLE